MLRGVFISGLGDRNGAGESVRDGWEHTWFHCPVLPTIMGWAREGAARSPFPRAEGAARGWLTSLPACSQVFLLPSETFHF